MVWFSSPVRLKLYQRRQPRGRRRRDDAYSVLIQQIRLYSIGWSGVLSTHTTVLSHFRLNKLDKSESCVRALSAVSQDRGTFGLVADMIELVRQYGRYGYRRIAVLLRQVGLQVNDKRIERLWRREGLKVPYKQNEAVYGSTTALVSV